MKSILAGIKSLLNRLHRKNRHGKGIPPTTDLKPLIRRLLQTPNSEPADMQAKACKNMPLQKISPGHKYNPFDWIRWVLRWTNIQVVCLCLIAAASWLCVWILAGRDYRVIDLPMPLISKVYGSIYSDNGVSDIEIERAALLALYSIHSYSFSHPQRLGVLQGIVNPNIISSAESEYSINKRKMTDSALVHNISVTDISSIERNAKNKRISVIVSGFLDVLTQENNAGGVPARTIPYRAELVFIVRPQSHLSKGETLYLLQISEAAGAKDVSIFDEALARTGRRPR